MVKNPFIPLDFAPRAPHIFAMSLPPGFLDELRTRVPISQVVGRKVSWDMRKSNQGKGDYWAPCPFHQEKTASFHVQDAKGFYYCFGCQAKGDAIGFIKETENVGFMEAVEILAAEAGMSVPKPDPKMVEKADRRKELADVMDEAVRWFQMSLKMGAAADARAYLDRRGLNGEALQQFEIGFAPNDRAGLKSALMGRGISEQQLVDTGLIIKPDDGGTSYDRFRGRIMFPIRDARGRCVAFGGRAMDPNARAKYLNSPETILFDKGRSLYNHGPARSAVGRGQPLIVAEGYMDVIALVRAGFEGAVAPLGTAITENQLAMMWQITPEPIIALDGDKAGLRAAYRLIDLAMPLLQTGRALRFALMPEGQDPDDLLRAKGQVPCRPSWTMRCHWLNCCGGVKPKAKPLTAPTARPRWINGCAGRPAKFRIKTCVRIMTKRSKICVGIFSVRLGPLNLGPHAISPNKRVHRPRDLFWPQAKGTWHNSCARR